MEAAVAAGEERLTETVTAVVASAAKKMSMPYSLYRKGHS